MKVYCDAIANEHNSIYALQELEKLFVAYASCVWYGTFENRASKQHNFAIKWFQFDLNF